MNNSPLVSIITSAYNHELYVENCILSILNQTYKKIEFIIFDDGSTDATAKKIEELQKIYNFCFVKQANQGVAATLNKALKMAKGKYVSLCASDDFYEPEKIEIQLKYMESHPEIAACFSNANYVDAAGRVFKTQNQKYSIFSFSDFFIRKAPGSAGSALIRKSVYDEVGYYNPAIAVEDYYMWLKITHAGHKIAYLPVVLFNYRMHGSNSTRNYRKMIDQHLQIYSEYKTHPDYNLAIQAYYNRQFAFFSRKDKKIAFEFLIKIRKVFNGRTFFKSLLFLILPIK